MNVKQPASVLWLIHSLEVLVISACFTLVLTLYQAFQSGNFSLQSTGVAAGMAALAVLGNGLKGMISNANFAQAVQDLFSELGNRQAVSPVTIHNNIPAAPAPTAQAPRPPAPPVPSQQFVSIPPGASTTNVAPTMSYMPSGTYPWPVPPQQ